MTRIKFTKGADFPAWTVLTFELPRTPSGKDERFIQSEHELKSRIDDFATVGLTSNGIKPGQLLWPPHAPIAVNDSNIDGPLHQGFKHILGLTRKPQVVLIILSRRSIPLYNRIKYLGDVVYGIHTVCVLCHKFFEVKGKDQYSANVGLKFNLKLGGMNQTLDDAKLGIVGQNKTMIVGLDVTHPSPGSSESAPSVAGMVANLDNKLAQWPGILRVQEARKEMVSDLGEMFQTRLQLWRGKHEQWLPENIIIYRDGVSEGQYQTVMEEEMPQFRETCRKLYSADMTKKGFPRMTCIIVGKRHHTRFYPTSAEEGKIDTNSSNPKNGTVVDRGVTEVRNWDFFLQSHTALKGTARPAHYFVLHDEIFTAEKPKAPFVNAADVLEDLTHNMSYLWGRATKAVSLCPPAYYADKLCERARCYLSHLFDGSPDPSTAGSTAGGSASDAERQRLLTAQRTSTTVHANLRDQMFYI